MPEVVPLGDGSVARVPDDVPQFTVSGGLGGWVDQKIVVHLFVDLPDSRDREVVVRLLFADPGVFVKLTETFERMRREMIEEV
jgi:hypothetical protein